MPEPRSSPSPLRPVVGLALVFVGLLLALVLPGTLAGDGVRDFSFFLPWAAVIGVLLLLAVWSLVTVDATIARLPETAGLETAARSDPATLRAALVLVFLILVALLATPWGGIDVGIGGVWGQDAIRYIGHHLRIGESFALVASAFNALTITVVAQLMWGCACIHRLALGKPLRGTADAFCQRATACQRAFVEMLQAGAAFAFVSTTALFLFFSLAEEIESVEKKSLVVASQPSVACTVDQANPALLSWRVECQLPNAASPQRAKGRVAASMAFAVGVVFAAVLFVSLLTAGRAVDTAVSAAESEARKAAPGATPFSSADWRKQQGLPDSSFAQSVIQAVLLFAPAAAAGLAVLLKS